MEEKKSIKISLRSIVIFFLIQIAIIIALVVYIINLKQQLALSQTEQNSLESFNLEFDSSVFTENNDQDEDKKEDNDNDNKVKEYEIPNDVETVTMDLNPESYMTLNGVSTIGFSAEIDNITREIELKIDDFNLPENLYTYEEEMIFRLTIGKQDSKVYKCEILNFYTNEVITDLSEDNIERLFNVEYGKEIQYLDWRDEIYFSELESNTLYQLTSPVEEARMPNLINDLPENYLLYIKSDASIFDDRYEKEIVVGNNAVDSNAVSFKTSSTFEIGEKVTFIFREIDTESLVKMIQEDKLLTLDSYNSGDLIDDRFQDYIYNNTDHVITLRTIDSTFNYESQEEKFYTLEPGKIYGYDWMIDQVFVEF